MKIEINSLLVGAQKARGNIAVIDVFRAFTTAAVALDHGAAHIVMVAEVDVALRCRADGVGDLCMGEVDGARLPNFDFGISPYQLSQTDVKDKIIILRTNAGTKGISAAAAQGGSLYAASLVTAKATAAALASDHPEQVTLVAMGSKGTTRTSEDEICALHIRNLLEGRSGDADAARRMILAGKEVAKFHDTAQPAFDPRDLAIALDIDRYNFAIRVTHENGYLIARKFYP